MAKPSRQLAKAPTGIQGLDEITGGGLPRGRPTLICGSAGCGKTLLAMEFLVHGVTQFGEPGVFMSFEETAQDLTQNFASLGFDLKALVARKQLALDFVSIDPSELEASGAYDLEGLFIRLGNAIDTIGAKRVVLDTIESLFAGLADELVLRTELRRLFRWLKDKGVTAVITGERGEGTLTRHGLEEYVSDCVIVLDHRVSGQMSARRLRVVKYRGSMHGTNEYPFLINESGVVVEPITSLRLQQDVSTERVPTGVERLDTMLGGGGYYRGSSVLISGTAGTGKSSLAAHYALAACRRGERVLYFAFEESASQIMRNMRSIGIDLNPWVEKGMLLFQANRPSVAGLESHLTMMYGAVNSFKPQHVIVDPLNSFGAGGSVIEVKAMLLRLVDFLKMHEITGLFTVLSTGGEPLEHTDIDISSLIDTWLLVRSIEAGGERNRGLYILKSRGMAHSNQIREFVLSEHGIELRDVYMGPSGALSGSARLAQAAQEQAADKQRAQEAERRQLELARKRKVMEVRVAALRAEFEAEAAETSNIAAQEQSRETLLAQERVAMGLSRQADEPAHPQNGDPA